MAMFLEREEPHQINYHVGVARCKHLLCSHLEEYSDVPEMGGATSDQLLCGRGHVYIVTLPSTGTMCPCS